MTILTVLLLIALVTLAGLSVQTGRKNRRQLHRLQAELARVSNRVGKRQAELAEFRNKKRLLESTVNTGTTAVEAVHRALSSTTFELIDRFSSNENLRQSARQARTTHDRTSRTLYRSLRTTNRALHVLTDMVMERKSGRRNDKE